MLKGSISGSNHIELFRSICQDTSLQGIPTNFELRRTTQRSMANWRERCLNANTECYAFWEDQSYRTIAGFSYLPKSEVVLFTLGRDTHPDVVATFCDEVPFELAVFATPFERAWMDTDYPRWGFGRSHLSHGWGCAFRGAGHDRLVSRRWLDFGPWRVIRRPNDTTFIQFHDLAIEDPAAAYAQAAPGHQRMGVDPIGGFIQGIDESVIAEVGGLYFAATRRLEIVVAQRIIVEQQDMRVACGLRLHHRLHPAIADRIDHVAYIFMERADAEAHLHELWLRELECWYLDGSGKYRLDLDYHPVPNPPAWVRALDDK